MDTVLSSDISLKCHSAPISSDFHLLRLRYPNRAVVVIPPPRTLDHVFAFHDCEMSVINAVHAIHFFPSPCTAMLFPRWSSCWYRASKLMSRSCVSSHKLHAGILVYIIPAWRTNAGIRRLSRDHCLGNLKPERWHLLPPVARSCGSFDKDDASCVLSIAKGTLRMKKYNWNIVQLINRR